jgi:RNA polymerase sigma-70 factor, ECF subfamily
LFSNKKDLSDELLLKRYQDDQDTESLGLLYDRYLHLVYGLCLKYLKSRELAQDAVMDIYETLAKKLPNQEISYFKSWLYMVSKNHCLMFLRKQNNVTSLDDTIMESAFILHPNTEEEDLEQNLVALEDCFKHLVEEQKACVSAFYLQRKSYQQIAEVLPMELKKVKSNIQNGKRNLKICLEGKNVEG